LLSLGSLPKSWLRSPVGLVIFMDDVESDTMEDKLQFWFLKESLSIYQAAVLACGEDPSLNYVETASDLEGYMIHGLPHKQGMPSGFDAFSQALIDDVKKDSRASLFTEDGSEMVFKEVQSNGRNPSDINIHTTLRVTDIRQWLTSKGIKPPFFFPEAEGDLTATSRPTYQTHLMSIMYETIERYYGENYDPNDRDTVPKQVNVIEWLKETYSLTGRQADAIDVLTRPAHVKSPKSKN